MMQLSEVQGGIMASERILVLLGSLQFVRLSCVASCKANRALGSGWAPTLRQKGHGQACVLQARNIKAR
jgi:hypothetical protein